MEVQAGGRSSPCAGWGPQLTPATLRWLLTATLAGWLASGVFAFAPAQ